ncbi:uncharacterized protein [Miscanthus floridulus]|uniref:uncharacterized protein n=1 Tax=Miscanthus floridulus TaxID=154761 RepID=UPI00345A3188
MPSRLICSSSSLIQMLIKNNRAIRHPLSDGPCAVLQYADDTIVVVRADADSARHLKRVLDTFAAATGLAINFSKSTVNTMNVAEDHLQSLVTALHCRQGTFPQTYLGAFLWSGSDRTTDAQCLIAWENVCALKEDGGLGVKRLETQNAALLLKLIHRLHHPGSSAWERWATSQTALSDQSGCLARAHWTALRQLLPAYQKMMTVRVGDGSSTDF